MYRLYLNILINSRLYLNKHKSSFSHKLFFAVNSCNTLHKCNISHTPEADMTVSKGILPVVCNCIISKSLRLNQTHGAVPQLLSVHSPIVNTLLVNVASLSTQNLQLKNSYTYL